MCIGERETMYNIVFYFSFAVKHYHHQNGAFLFYQTTSKHNIYDIIIIDCMRVSSVSGFVLFSE